jgi:hypothetical protein
MTETYVLPDLDIATKILSVFRGSSTIDPFVSPYVFPAPVPAEAQDLRTMATAILGLTGWSHRRLATALGTTHPTIANILGGRAEGPVWRNSEYRTRLREMHTVVERIAALAPGDKSQVRSLLVRPTEGGTAIDHMAAGRFDDAYLAAIETLRPARDTRLITGQRPRPVGENTVALDGVE